LPSTAHCDNWNQLLWMAIRGGPISPGDDPDIFFCTYSATSSGAVDHTTLTGDNNAGLCFGGGGPTSAGTWTGGSAGGPGPDPDPSEVPEPQSLVLLSGGLAGLTAVTRRKSRAR
jgi:hypothetical protein